ncbi:MAG TPA: hypothetical protein VJO35_19605 [Terriglobales bacterium]|nr:hypothetical protein [Terriglobales bacterium]
MSALPLVIFLVATIWSISQSSKRVLTVVWIISSLGVVVGLLWVLSVLVPYGPGVLGHAAAPASFLTSAIFGIGHAKAHPRTAASSAQ